MFDIPKRPFILTNNSKKEYLLVIEPLNTLYRYNKKEETIQIDPLA